MSHPQAAAQHERIDGSTDLSMTVVVCVYTFDRFKDIQEAVESVRMQRSEPTQIVIVVDHNPALLADLSKALPSDVAVISNQRERGLSGARNTGVAYATADLVTFIDDDVIVQPGCLDHLANRCRDANVIGAGAMIVAQWARTRPEWFPDEFLWVVGCSYKGMRLDVTRNLLGAAMCIKRQAFAIAGGFTSELGRTRSGLAFGCEETEFCIRATRHLPGKSFVIEPAARVVHKVTKKRAAWSYFVSRCYAEGLSKAKLRGLVGNDRSLATERSYVVKTLPAAIRSGFDDLFFRGAPAGLSRVAAIVIGVLAAAVGYVQGRIRSVVTGAATPPGADRGAGGDLTAGAKEAQPSGSQPFASGSRSRIESALMQHHVLFSNAGLLALGTAASSALGFVYWWFAAHAFPARSVGYAAAAISLMNLIGHFGEVGLGALLMGETHRFGDRRGAFVSAGLLVSFCCSALFATAYLAANSFFGIELGTLSQSLGSALIFALGCALSGLTLVLDQGMVGLLRSHLQVFRNISFATIKLGLLVLLPLTAAIVATDELAIFMTWVIGQVVSIAALGFILAARRRETLFCGPALNLLRPLLPRVLSHHVLNLANLAPGLLLPFVVTVVLSPIVNAAFYAAWMLVSVAYLVPASLATVVYAVGSKEPEGMASKLRVSLGSSVAFGVVGAAFCYLFSGLILWLFNPAYPLVAGASLALLGLSIPVIAVKYHYVAIQRLRNEMAIASILVAAGCALELAGATIGARRGLDGLTLGWLAGLTVETALMLPVVIAAMWSEGGAAPKPDDRRRSARRAPQGPGHAAATGSCVIHDGCGEKTMRRIPAASIASEMGRSGRPYARQAAELTAIDAHGFGAGRWGHNK
jgi:GT2 family glycosyltransferase/O-antigen/teichoic acid export membrane protein